MSGTLASDIRPIYDMVVFPKVTHCPRMTAADPNCPKEMK